MGLVEVGCAFDEVGASWQFPPHSSCCILSSMHVGIVHVLHFKLPLNTTLRVCPPSPASQMAAVVVLVTHSSEAPLCSPFLPTTGVGEGASGEATLRLLQVPRCSTCSSSCWQPVRGDTEGGPASDREDPRPGPWVCSGCRVAYYCSTTCQGVHWAWPGRMGHAGRCTAGVDTRLRLEGALPPGSAPAHASSPPTKQVSWFEILFAFLDARVELFELLLRKSALTKQEEQTQCMPGSRAQSDPLSPPPSPPPTPPSTSPTQTLPSFPPVRRGTQC